MNVSKFLWFWNGGSPFTPSDEYQAVLNKAISDGDAEPPEAQQVKQNTLISGLASDTDLAAMDIFYMLLNQGSEGFGSINWAAPTTFKLSPVGDVAWFSNQGSRAGTTGYYTTGYNPGSVVSKFLRDNNCFGAYVLNDVDTSRSPIGAYLVNTSGIGNIINPHWSTGGVHSKRGLDNNNTFTAKGTGQVGNGLTCARRISSTEFQLSHNGVDVGTPVAANSSAIVNLAWAVCGVLINPGFTSYTNGVVVAAFAGSGDISPLRVYNRLATYIADPYALTPSGVPATLDVDIAFGQSNLEGTGDLASLPLANRQPIDKGLIWNQTSGTWQKYQAGINSLNTTFFQHGLEATYLKAYDDAAAYRGYIKIAKGSTWVANNGLVASSWSPALVGSLYYTRLIPEITAALASRPCNVKSFTIYIGENDSTTEAQANAFEANITAIISGVRTLVGNASLPVTIFRIHNPITDVAGFTYTQNISDQIDALVISDPLVTVIETNPYSATLLHVASAGLQSLGDDLYDVNSLY